MAITSYDSLLPYVLTETEGVSHPLAISAINRAVRRLCLESSCWFSWQNVTLIAGEADYQLVEPNASSAVRNIKSVQIEGIELAPIPESVVSVDRPWLMTNSGTPTSYYAVNGDLHLMPTPTESDVSKSCRVKAAYIPLMDAQEADESLLYRHAETITAGAKSILLMMHGQTWTNPTMAQVYLAEFEKGIGRARIEVEQSESMSGLQVKKRRFGF